MDYFSVFDISASGMAVQKARLDAVALNLANVNTTRGLNGGPYQKKTVIMSEKSLAAFEKHINPGSLPLKGVEVSAVKEMDIAPRMVYEPAHPHADEKGFVAYPNIEPASEMMILIEATRAYEANVKAILAAKTMAQRALEIGGR